MEVINQVETLSLRELEEATDTSLFVINNTQPRGEIIFNITTTRGRDHTAMVPDTWIPFDLTTQAKKQEILDSPDFRRAVSQKYLIIVATSSADKYMDSSELAQSELDRIFNRNKGQNNIANNSTTGNLTAKQRKLNEIQSSAGGAAIEADNKVAGAVIQIVNRSNSEGDDKMEVKEALSLLVGRKLSEEELKYIVMNSTQAEIKAFASKKV